jgi:hypothetical protein
MYDHVRRNHSQYFHTTECDPADYLCHEEEHKCKKCGENVLHDFFALKMHMKITHNSGIYAYFKEFVVSDCHEKKKPVAKKLQIPKTSRPAKRGSIFDPKWKNSCQFSCRHCDDNVFLSWATMLAHVRNYHVDVPRR